MSYLTALLEFNFVSVCVRLIMSVVLGGAIGTERGRHGRAAGLRTHILVCLGSTMATMVGMYTTQVLGYASDPLRVGAQVISGIGFLGAGTILVRGSTKIIGLTTAATLWATATIGLAVGIGFYEGAVVCSAAIIMTTAVLAKLEAGHTDMKIYLEINNIDKINETVDTISWDYFNAKRIQITPAKTGTSGNVGIEAVLHQKYYDSEAVLKRIRNIDHVVFVLKEI